MAAQSGMKPGSWRRIFMLGAVMTVMVPVGIAGVIYFRPPRALDNLLNDNLVGWLREVTPGRSLEGFQDGFEGISASAPGTTKIEKIERGPDGSYCYTKVQPWGNVVTTEFDGHGRITSVKGTIKLSDGRNILFDRVYLIQDKNKLRIIEDRSVITDYYGRELRNDLVETCDSDGRTLSVKGVMRSSSGREYKVNRTYIYPPSSIGSGVKHKDEQ